MNDNTDDDPCWGGPEPSKHSLAYLLQQINKEDTIIHECPSYLAINKPPDLRMDGPYRATVHKLITYWYPSPSLLSSLQQSKQNERNKPLLDLLTPLSKFNHLPDNELRPCHQLDYATSGVLLIARSKEAAHQACLSFESRNISKEYIAIVHGHINTNTIPILHNFDIQTYLNNIESKYKRNRKKRKKESFVGFMPPHAIFEKWKSWKRRGGENDIDDLVFQKLDISKEVELELKGIKWSMINQKHKQYKQAFIDITNEWNTLKKSKMEENEVEEDIPHIFRIHQDDDYFYINAPIAVTNTFYMMIHPTVLNKIPHSKFYSEKLTPNTTELDYKPALTKCKILSKGIVCHNQKITKVSLSPLTGRRHQLRLHMVVSGHAILGDVSYEYDKCDGVDRMCLHAHRLSLFGEMEFVAPDPFRFGDGVLSLDKI